MTTLSLPQGARRGLVVRALLRALGTAALLVVLYYVAPMKRPSDAGTVVVLAICLIVLIGLIVWQVRAIVGAQYPALRAIEALAATTPAYILVFASTYFLMGRAQATSFTEPLTRTDALYFSITIFSSVGFGDITPKSQAARMVVSAQMFLDLIVLGLAVRVFVSAVRIGQQRRSAGEGD